MNQPENPPFPIGAGAYWKAACEQERIEKKKVMSRYLEKVEQNAALRAENERLKIENERMRLALNIAEIADRADNPDEEGNDLLIALEDLDLSEVWSNGSDLHEAAANYRDAALNRVDAKQKEIDAVQGETAGASKP